MPPQLLACGSNSASHLSINHPDDVFTLTPTVYHPSSPPIPDTSTILDLVSTSAHSLLLMSTPSSEGDVRPRNILLGAGTNTCGQLGPRCALWDDIKPEARWKPLNLLNSVGVGGDWEPVKIASTWTTSFVVYQRISDFTQDQSVSSSMSQVDTGYSHIKGNDVEQIVLSCGSNDFGELGSTTNVPLTLDAPAEIPISQASRKPTIVEVGLRRGEKVEIIQGGQRHVIVIISGRNGEQRVMGWGASRKGELDASTLSSNLTNGSKSSASNKAKGKGKGKAVSRSTTSPPTKIDLQIPPGERFIDVSLGASHTLALLSNGTVLGWGSNLKGQITDIHLLKDVKCIAATWNGSYFLTKSNRLLSQGSNTHSQLLRGPDAETVRGEVEKPDGWGVDRIVAGSEHLLVHMKSKDMEEGEELWTGGWNEHGNLALRDQEDRAHLTRVGINGKIRGLWGGCASTWIWVG
ncbi:hypothetical protein I204_04484 [Kwoniella mangroviensis CBS 8886]|uniref:uncharacterized protein n=1 Tax=Kwoniella mangroviensis CBS 8507 TaxID=1296122 RepID=UPI00080CDB8E|nr:uncharacterized protein I203_04315 [Kwoniella mangroviensis CBS 8507]OCF66739.1 hypothetical protein I203_04315 [Kwoniella mangroviensis CBS 8507]OCF74114.1 hypothetical protein I204_04484 [Kwoniella mangroviensis CBS 8886]